MWERNRKQVKVMKGKWREVLAEGVDYPRIEQKNLTALCPNH